MSALLPAERLLDEHEWRSLGVQQSRGWVHYGYYKPEPNILLFRRPVQQRPRAAQLAVQAVERTEEIVRAIAVPIVHVETRVAVATEVVPSRNETEEGRGQGESRKIRRVEREHVQEQTEGEVKQMAFGRGRTSGSRQLSSANAGAEEEVEDGGEDEEEEEEDRENERVTHGKHGSGWEDLQTEE